MGKEHFGRLEHTRRIIWRNILGDWNTRGLTYGVRTFWEFETHKDDHTEKEHFGRLEHMRTIIWGKEHSGTFGTHEEDHLG